MKILIPLLLLMTPALAEISPEYQSKLKSAIDESIAKNECPGAVLLIGNKDGVIFKRAYGNRAVEPEKITMTTDTIFDLASLSKPIGCATSIMILADQGKLNVADKASKYLPGMN